MLIEESNIEIVEVAFRSNLAVKAIEKYSTIAGVIIGAGTVRTVKEAKQAVEAGAQFLVSPGYDSDVVKFAVSNDVPITPGVLKPTEIQKGVSEANLSILKLFPAELIGEYNAVMTFCSIFFVIYILNNIRVYNSLIYDI